ncbi:transposase [Shinella sp. S4-D37]|uniref:transposase n=1 Tax=Shinella sp. S4-D37 TaxID=3161999 RepID=UPI0034656F35
MAHGIGRTKGGRNTKLHAVCDAKGRPVVLLLTPGNVHDCKVAQRCIEATPPSSELVADKGYDSQALRAWLDERGTQAVIARPARSGAIGQDRLLQGGV